MSGAWRLGRTAGVAWLVAAGSFGCGQQGPLVLPESARPIERLEQPAAEPSSATDSESQDDERRDER